MLTAGRRGSLCRCYECVFDVLQIDFCHRLGGREVLRPGHIRRPVHCTQRRVNNQYPTPSPRKGAEQKRKWSTIIRPSVFVGKRDGRVRTPRAVRARLHPRRERRRLAARMRELDTDLRHLRMRKFDYPLERRDLRVRPEPRVLGRDAALGNNRGRFHDDAPRAARRKALAYT